jgi:hypothetical protein
VYGGECICDATCIYSDKGPWREDVNETNFADANEEFKYEDEDDVDSE